MAEAMHVFWHEGANSLDNRSRYGIATLLNEAFDMTKEFEFIHYSTMNFVPNDLEEAIVIIHGEHEKKNHQQIEHDIAKFKRAIVIDIGDEGSHYPLKNLQGSNRKLWVQMPITNRHNYASRFLICGYPHDAKMHLAHYDALAVDRRLDWSFSGQVQHWRRREAVNAMKFTHGNGFCNMTSGFWRGFDRAEYYKLMAESKLAICPAGTCTPDTMRMAEALEAGCLPIVDDMYPFNHYNPDMPFIGGYWKYVLKQQPPFPVVKDWKDLPNIVSQALQDWPHNRDIAVAWWKEYKQSMYKWISEDIRDLRRTIQ